MPRQSRTIDLLHQRFGYLTVIARHGRLRKYATWICRCDCGNEIVVPGDRLRRRKTRSCGKGHRWSVTQANALTHSSWRRMHERCKNNKHQQWVNYGGRGIIVHPRWDDFKNFLVDMGPRPSRNHSIEREDANGNYEPGNCVWATAAEQSRNKRNSVFVTYQGKKILLLDLVLELGLSRSVVYGRLKAGWPLEQALAIPVRPKKKNSKRN